MKAVVRYSIFSFLVLLFAAGTGVGLWAVRDRSEKRACCGIEVTILDPESRFVSKEDVTGWIIGECGTPVGLIADSLNLAKMERVLDSKSAILCSQAWTTPDGILNISVSQRKPAVRFLKGSGGFYADRTCYLFPLHPTYTAPVMTVAGALPVKADSGFKGEAGSVQEKEWIEQVVRMSDEIEASQWAGKIDSVHVSADRRLSFSVETGEKVLFGPVGNTTDKLHRLSTYFERIKNGETQYTSVNLEFDGQIICRQ